MRHNPRQHITDSEETARNLISQLLKPTKDVEKCVPLLNDQIFYFLRAAGMPPEVSSLHVIKILKENGFEKRPFKLPGKNPAWCWVVAKESIDNISSEIKKLRGSPIQATEKESNTKRIRRILSEAASLLAASLKR